MRPAIILCIILSGDLASRAQLNFEGNPLTENTEYKAEESNVSGRNVRQDHQRFADADGRPFNASTVSFTVSPIDDVATVDKYHVRATNDTRKKDVSRTTKAGASPLEELPAPRAELKYDSVSNEYTSASRPESQKDEVSERSPESFAIDSVRPTDTQSPLEDRQLRKNSVQTPRLMSHRLAAVSQDSFRGYGQSQNYNPSDQSLPLRNAETSPLSASAVNVASTQALNEFLNSQTPETSQMALENYLAIREQATRGINGLQPDLGPVVQSEHGGIEQRGDIMFDGNSKVEQLGLDRRENENFQRPILVSDVAPRYVIPDGTVPASYSPGQEQQYASPRGDRLNFRTRPNMATLAGPGRQTSRYRGQVGGRFHGRPRAQSRIDPRPPLVYHHHGPVYGGGPPGPPAGPAGKWKPPVEVIYTRPPGFGYGPSPHSNPPVPYEDASHWFPDADQPPPQKDVYYSELYAQSYDPHYYNYIANTGKIKPWLYGKLGKHESKSIWWELFAGFKKYGMKNIMNPMFLLGMTIPTLTIMLSALVQKRSLGRSDSGDRVTETLIDEFVRRLQEDIACYEKRLKEESNDTEDHKS